MSSNRIDAIDAARGTAMLGVFLSHFAYGYFNRGVTVSYLPWLFYVAMLASPMFMIISGVVLGFLYETHKENFEKIKLKLIVRGLFLMGVGHILIVIAHIPAAGSIVGALHWGFITDIIGMNLVIGPLLIGLIRPRERIAFGVLLYAFSIVVGLAWHPTAFALQVFKEMIFGEEYGKGVFTEFFPFIPWFSLYFLSSCIGERIGRYHLQNNTTRMAALVFKVAVGSLCSVLVLKVGFYLVNVWGLLPDSAPLFRALVSLFHKRPPLPGYFLFFGGVGLLLLFALLKFERQDRLSREFSKVLVMVGRTSLFVFIVQYYVYFGIFTELRLPYSPLWPAYFLLSVAFILLLSKMWYQKRIRHTALSWRMDW
ncbi:MAG: acyltransferase family protein [Bacteroidota bacterium]